MGATQVEERVLASLGQLNGVATRFEPCADVPNGGVLLALPALQTQGLLRHCAQFFPWPEGYYTMPQIFLLLAFLTLARLKSIESLRYCSPGEWGKLLGLDRIPEVRTVREKVKNLTSQGQVGPWSSQLCQDWMEADPESTGLLYVDGHVRVYHGEQTKLPRHYVARQRLCLRATTDYWVNALGGAPFFVVSRPVDPGLIKVLREEIIPRLIKEVPRQPSGEALAADPALNRFILIFDREGYSPELLKHCQEERIGCLTYHKHPGPDWPAEEFVEQTVKLAGGQQEQMKLCERRAVLSNDLEIREVRQLQESGHQTSIICTDERLGTGVAASAMFGRWCQENYLKYMREHFALDRLIDYGTEPMDETKEIVNPRRRQLESQVRQLNGQISRKLAVFGGMNLAGEIEAEKVESFMKKKGGLQMEIEGLQKQLAELKATRPGVAQHIQIKDLPEADRFSRLSSASKHFIDTIKMIAYRAETSMSQLLKEQINDWHKDEARRHLQAIYKTEADLIPDEKASTLTVRLHYPANAATARALEHLCTELTETETVFPGTNLRLIYKLISGQNP